MNYLQLKDEDLMKLYIDGDAMAFEYLYNRHKDRVYTYLNRRLLDSQVVDDVFQSVFVKFHKSRDRYSEEYPLLAWLYTIARSETLDHLKKRKLETSEFIDENFMAASSSEDFHSEINLEEEKSLSDNEKIAIQLRYLSDKDFDEIAKKLNTSKLNSRKLVSRGLKKLKLKYSGEK
ncbi:MAG: RNA polymerase sigma factor [Bdellovibrionota bacterium]|mgnify:FL=1|nr:hypothetical protein [Pseudobdellovibrionaceae bacterium]|tara:strand:+ start:41088 stop:41615 length:528 start_codon:yes stop_codon:yes gene_type:complete